MVLSSECQTLLENSINLYNAVILGSLSLTIFKVALYFLCLKKQLEGSPGLHSQFFLVFAAVKLLLAVLLFAVLQPSCPPGCGSCSGVHLPVPIYPVVALLIGIRWLCTGISLRRQALVVTNTGEGGKGDVEAVFDKVPTVEMA